MVDITDDGDSCFPWGIPPLRIDQVGDLEVQRQVGLKVLGAAGLLYVSLQRGRTRVAHDAEAISGSHAR